VGVTLVVPYREARRKNERAERNCAARRKEE
jgi:hypothetical protein